MQSNECCLGNGELQWGEGVLITCSGVRCQLWWAVRASICAGTFTGNLKLHAQIPQQLVKQMRPWAR